VAQSSPGHSFGKAWGPARPIALSKQQKRGCGPSDLARHSSALEAIAAWPDPRDSRSLIASPWGRPGGSSGPVPIPAVGAAPRRAPGKSWAVPLPSPSDWIGSAASSLPPARRWGRGGGSDGEEKELPGCPRVRAQVTVPASATKSQHNAPSRPLTLPGARPASTQGPVKSPRESSIIKSALAGRQLENHEAPPV